MSKKRQNFGSTAEEVDNNIINLENERKTLADKMGNGRLSSKENKRFDEIGNILVEANESRTEFQAVPGDDAPPATFDIDQNTVIGDDGGAGNGLVPPPQNNIPQSGAPNQDVSLAGPTGQVNLGGGDGSELIAPTVPINTPEDPTQNIVNQTLQGINRDDSGGLTQDINTATFGGDPKQQGKGLIQESTDPLIQQGARTTLGVNDPILKGNVGGSIIGNQPVFVGGGDFLATDVINNRKKAIQDAATQRASEAQELLSRKPPIIKDQAFQSNLNDQFYGTYEGFIADAKDKFGDKWDLALKDQTNPLGRQFVQSMDNFDFVAKASDQVTDAIAEVESDLKSGDQVFSDGTLDILDNYKSLQDQFANGDINGQISLREEFDKLQGFKGLDRVLKDDSIDVKGTVTQFASILEDSDKFVTTTQKKTAYEDQLKTISKDIADNQMRDPVRKGLISEDQIFEHMKELYGYENIISKKIKTKPAPPGGIKVNVDLGNKFEGEKIEKVGGTNYTVGQSFELPTGNKKLEVSGLKFFDPATGKLVQEDGVKNVDINAFQVVKVPNEDGSFDWKKVAVATVDKLGQKVNKETGFSEEVVVGTETKLYDLEDLGPRVLTDLIDDPSSFNNMQGEMDRFINQGKQLTNTESALEFLKE